MPELLDQHIDRGAGKRSATADLTDADALRLVRELAASADIVMPGYRPGALARFGLDPGTGLRRRNDLRLVDGLDNEVLVGHVVAVGDSDES
jgi:hypothetical protein